MGSKHESEIPGLNIEYLKLKGFNVHELPASVDISVSSGGHNFHKMDLGNPADIAYSTGFEYPTCFNNYFKRVTGTTPKSLRK